VTSDVTTDVTTDPVALLRQMLLIRRFEERCVELYSGGAIRGFMHLSIGEEAVAAGMLSALTPDDDVVSTYRDHAHALARGVPARSVMAELFGRQEGCSRGRGGSMHLFDASRRFFGGNAIVGGGLPLAIGLALATSMRGEQRVTACFFGEGAAAEGEFHEALNLAALWHLPVLFCCENNLYAMGTALQRSEAQPDLVLKAAAEGIPGAHVDGMDVVEVAEAATRAAEAVRGGAGPRVLEQRPYRFRAPTMYDPERYRSKEAVARGRQRDPIPALSAVLLDGGALDQSALAELEREVGAEIDDAVAYAEAGTDEPVDDLTRFVTSEVPS
jgi:pyruvate dehydrogenase E1 component alpha subunit